LSHRPRKRFGQNFLHDPVVVARIVAAIDPRPEDHLVEIGPGEGVITGPLLATGARLDAVELDRDLAVLLRERFAGEPAFCLHQADALRFGFCALQRREEPLRLVGNLPYNISTPLLFHLLDQRRCIKDMHFMLQKEVVDRLAAAHGSRTYGRLSVMLQVYCRIGALFTIGPGAFRPAPKVASAIVRLEPYAEPPWPVTDRDHLARLVAAAFGQRRKTLRNNLKGLVMPQDFAAADIDPGMRPEDLAPADFVALANLTCNRRDAP
jgi:16S rRNA (adenine1518-N6/adenine1519-N6)-dimethyltransferase